MLEEVKNYLAITWDDEITNSNVQNSINEGMDYLQRIVGSSIDFDADLTARALLKDYCRYVRNYSLEYFEINFRSSLIRLQLEYANKNTASSI
jgi:hypothetical protein